MIILFGNPTTKKNSQKIIVNQRTGRPMVVQGEKYRWYEQTCLWRLLTQKDAIAAEMDGKKPPYNCKYIFYRDSERIVDETNLQSAMDDILVAAGVLPDDNFKIIGGHDGSRVRIDRENPRVEITITELED